MSRVSSILRWIAFLIMPPIVGVATFLIITLTAEKLMYRESVISTWLGDSWAVEGHVWPVLFGWGLVLFHFFIVLPTAAVQALRHRVDRVPLAFLAPLCAIGIALLAVMVNASLHSIISGCLIPIIVLGLPFGALLVSARVCVQPRRTVLPNHG